jgi:hypothetical protein
MCARACVCVCACVHGARTCMFSIIHFEQNTETWEELNGIGDHPRVPF